MRRVLIAIGLASLHFVALAANDLDAAAKDVCACMEEPYRQTEKVMALIKAAQSSGDVPALESAQEDMMRVMGEYTRCLGALSKKYPEINESKALQEKVMSKSNRQCPHPAAELFRSR